MMPRHLMLRALAALFCSLAAVESTAAQESVRITVIERAGAARRAEYVTFGLPIPRGWNVKDPRRLRLLDENGQAVPAQFEVLARWGAGPGEESAPIKWVLVGCIQSVAANATKTLTLDASGPPPAPQQTVRIDRSAEGKIVVETGPARFEINTKHFNLFDQVSVGGAALLAPLGASDAIEYSPAGELSVVAGGAEVAESNRPRLAPRPTQAVIERAGPLCAVVKVAGSILDQSQRAILDYTARLHFAAGRSDVRLDFTVENNHPIIAGQNGQPTNAHNQGAANSVYVGALKLQLRLSQAGGDLSVLAERDVDVQAPKAAVRLYQDSSGTETWNAYVGLVGWEKEKASAVPRLQSRCTRKGYEITGSPGGPVTGDQALGWMSVRRGQAGPRLTVAVRDFWQNFPKAIEASPNGTVSIDLFPNGDRFRHNLRVGEEKTHTILLDFGTGPVTAQQAEAKARAFNAPLFGAAEAAWYVASGALGEVPAADLKRWPLYERFVRTAFEPNPDFDPSKDDPNYANRTLRQMIERYNFYGWQDYGDLPLDYEAFGPNQAGQMNLKYWCLNGMLMQFCRSGDLRWMDLAVPAARHLADIDYLHIPDEGIRHWAHGAYFGHSQHDEHGNLNPNRNSNSPSVDLFFGVPDLLLAYHLTGERRFRDVAMEGLLAMQNLSQFSDFGAAIFERERANLIFAYMEGYRQTGQDVWLKELQKVVRSVTDLSNKKWAADPADYGKANPESYVRMFMLSQVLWSVGKYLDFCAEFGLKDELGAADALAAYAQFVVEHAMNEYAPGRAAVPYDYYFDRSEKSYLDINNWALVTADALAYAYKYTGRKQFIDAAAKFYATGTIDPVWKDDPPVYLATKDLVNSCNWGLVYMNELLQAEKNKRPK